MTLFNDSFSSVSVFDVCSRQYHDACVCIPLLANKVQRIRVLSQNAGSCVTTITRIHRGVLIFAFFALKKYYYIEPLMSHGLFKQCPIYLNLCSEDERRSYGFGTT